MPTCRTPQRQGYACCRSSSTRLRSTRSGQAAEGRGAPTHPATSMLWVAGQQNSCAAMAPTAHCGRTTRTRSRSPIGRSGMSPRFRSYRQPKVNAREYLEMLRTVGAAAKAVDPSAEIVTAGLAGQPSQGRHPTRAISSRRCTRRRFDRHSTPSRSTPTRSTRATWASLWTARARLMNRGRWPRGQDVDHRGRLVRQPKEERAKHRFCLGSRAKPRTSAPP